MPELAAHLERVAKEHDCGTELERQTLTAKDVKLAIQQGNSLNAEGFVEFDYEGIAKALNAALRGRNGV